MSTSGGRFKAKVGPRLSVIDRPIDRVLQLLRGVKKTANGWDALCPAHDDERPSLGIAVGDDGRVLLNCRSVDCTAEAIVNAIGLTMADLYVHDRNGKHSKKKSLGPIVATFDYRDETGALLYQVVRHDPKAFVQRRPDGKGGWIWNLDGVRRVPHRLPELLAAPLEVPVYIPEGEKDCDNLVRLGLVATTNAQGAGKWPTLDANTVRVAFRGRSVVLLSDNDDVGRQHVQQVAENLYGNAASVKVVELPGLPEKGDVSDWLNAGGTVEQLAELAAAAPEWAPSEGDDNSPDCPDLPDDWQEPTPLGKLPPASPFPLDIFPDPLRRVVDEVCFACNVPPDFPAVQALALASAAIASSPPTRHY